MSEQDSEEKTEETDNLLNTDEDAEESGEAPRIVVPQGTFTIVTDGRILANNTDEGPKPHARGQSLSWTVGPSTQQPPTALVAFD